MSVAHCIQTARDRQQWRTLVYSVISDSQHWGWNATTTNRNSDNVEMVSVLTYKHVRAFFLRLLFLSVYICLSLGFSEWINMFISELFDANFLIVADYYQRKVYQLKPETGEVRAILTEPCRPLAFTPDPSINGTYVICVTQTDTNKYYNIYKKTFDGRFNDVIYYAPQGKKQCHYVNKFCYRNIIILLNDIRPTGYFTSKFWSDIQFLTFTTKFSLYSQ